VLVDDGPADVVMVGFHRNFDYDRLRRAATAVRRGARLIGTNDDPVYPTPDGPIPGGGAILAAVQTAAGVEPLIAGKPHDAMADLVRATVGDAAAVGAVMVGDRPDTDGLFAARLGCRFALVWSGVTSPGDVVDPRPDLDGADLSEIADHLLGSVR
jgi:4-nitrophenyl phosphatase